MNDIERHFPYLYFQVISYSVLLYQTEEAVGEHIATVLFSPPQDLDAMATLVFNTT